MASKWAVFIVIVMAFAGVSCYRDGWLLFRLRVHFSEAQIDRCPYRQSDLAANSSLRLRGMLPTDFGSSRTDELGQRRGSLEGRQPQRQPSLANQSRSIVGLDRSISRAEHGETTTTTTSQTSSRNGMAPKGVIVEQRQDASNRSYFAEGHYCLSLTHSSIVGLTGSEVPVVVE